MLIYASVNSAFSGFASLEIPLVIHVPKEMGLFNIHVGQPLFLWEVGEIGEIGVIGVIGVIVKGITLISLITPITLILSQSSRPSWPLFLLHLIYLLADDAGSDGDILGTGTTLVILLGARRWGRILLLQGKSQQLAADD